MKIKAGILWLLCAGLLACKGQGDMQAQQEEKETALGKIVEANGIRYYIALKTAEQMAYLRAYDMSTQKLDQQRYAEELGNTRDHYFFVITQKGRDGRNVLEEKVSSKDDYSKRLLYYQAEAGQDIRMVACTDTLIPDAYLYENNMGVVAQNRMVIAFPVPTQTCDVQLIFNDRAFDNYLVRSGFLYNDIKNAPKTNLN